jgi:hypothetical protein
MKPIKIVGLCLVAVFAMSAVVAASASAAEPEYMTCVKAAKVGKTYIGKYTSKTCSEASKVETGGKYELGSWELAKTKALKIASKAIKLDNYSQATGKIVPGVGGVVKCTSGKGSGELVGSRSTTQKIEYKGCQSEGKECKSTKAGTKNGVITEDLATYLVALPEGKGVGVLSYAEPAGWYASYSCGTVLVEMTSGPIGVDSGNTTEASKTSATTFAVTAEGVQQERFADFEEVPAGPFNLETEVKAFTGEEPYPPETPPLFASGLEGKQEIKGEALLIHT